MATESFPSKPQFPTRTDLPPGLLKEPALTSDDRQYRFAQTLRTLYIQAQSVGDGALRDAVLDGVEKLMPDMVEIGEWGRLDDRHGRPL